MEIKNHIYHFSVDPKATGERIRDLRKAKGLTADKLAEKLYRSPKTISSWETGTRFPSIDNLVDLANLFEVSVHSLMLPNDNCDVECLETNPSIAGTSDHLKYEYSIEGINDETFAKLFTREDYLIQRLLLGVFTKSNLCEYETVVKEFLNHNCQYTLFKGIGNSSKAYFDFLRENKARYETFHVILNRMLYGEPFHKTLSALNSFDRDVFFTALLYFSELRKNEYMSFLYDLGARFVDCNFIANVELIENGMKDTPHKKIFNIKHKLINSEADLDEWVGATDKTESEKQFLYDFLELPRFFEDQSYYQGKVLSSVHFNETENIKARRLLCAYYFLLDFVRDCINTFEHYEKRSIDNTELSYDQYVEHLINGGFISE